jgi:hypothetical protein
VNNIQDVCWISCTSGKKTFAALDKSAELQGPQVLKVWTFDKERFQDQFAIKFQGQ